MKSEYRRCVGMMILNNKNEILVGKRIDHPSGYWQMPQGGIDENEIPEKAVWREMMEEIGTNNAELIYTSSKWFSYDIPIETLKTLPWGKKYVGQTQLWFIFRFLGKKNEINVNIDKKELEIRKKLWVKPDLKFKSGILYKYSKLVSSASNGCVTD